MLASCFAVFASVFGADLGDKAQLAAALFAGAGDRPKWLVILTSSARIGLIMRGALVAPKPA